MLVRDCRDLRAIAGISDASSCHLGVAKHSSVMSEVLVSSYISEGDLGSRFDERTGNSKT
jgi:hypothetical protein